jgi:hypothetical protein
MYQYASIGVNHFRLGPSRLSRMSIIIIFQITARLLGWRTGAGVRRWWLRKNLDAWPDEDKSHHRWIALAPLRNTVGGAIRQLRDLGDESLVFLAPINDDFTSDIYCSSSLPPRRYLLHQGDSRRWRCRASEVSRSARMSGLSRAAANSLTQRRTLLRSKSG